MLELVRLMLVKGVYVLLDQLPVVGMSQLHQLVVGGHELLRFVAVDSENLVGPEELTGLYVPFPVAEAGYPLRLHQPGLALAQGFFGLLALGYVVDHTADSFLLSVGDHARARLDVYQPPVLAAVLPLAFVAPPLSVVAPDVALDVLALVGDEVVDGHP